MDSTRPGPSRYSQASALPSLSPPHYLPTISLYHAPHHTMVSPLPQPCIHVLRIPVCILAHHTHYWYSNYTVRDGVLEIALYAIEIR